MDVPASSLRRPGSEPDDPTEPRRTRSRFSIQRLQTALTWTQQGGLAVALLLMCAYFASSSSEFLSSDNLLVILLNIAVLGIVAVPGAMLILSGYVDLAIGSVAALAAVVFGEVASGGEPIVAIGVGLATGTVWGVVTGVLVTTLRFSAIIVTLGGFAGARGLAEALQQGDVKQGFGDTFAFIGNGDVLGVPMPVVLMIVAFAIGGYVWYLLPVGKHMTALGADVDAAYANGVAVDRIPIVLYAASGLAAAVGGLVITSQIDSASIQTGTQLELQTLTAILLGGLAFAGGRGSLVGVALGVLFIGALNNGLVLLNIGPFYANLAIGASLVLAAGLDAVYRHVETLPIAQLDPDDETDARFG